MELLGSGSTITGGVMNRLNLGCGRDIKNGWVNLDKAGLPGVDVVHDLDVLPLPFEDDHFDQVLARDVLEHVNYIPLLKEIHRILKVGAELIIQVPHFSSADNYIDPTHKNQFSIRTFEFFVSSSISKREYYFDFQFNKIGKSHVGFFKWPLIYNYIIEPIVNSSNKMKKYYELTCFCSLFPAQNIIISLIK